MSWLRLSKDREKLSKLIDSAKIYKFESRENVECKDENRAELEAMLIKKDLKRVQDDLKISCDGIYGRHMQAMKTLSLVRLFL